MTTLPSDIVLSVCLSGRNDDYYGGKFKQRLAFSVNFFAENAKKLGYLNQVEVVITDWNSDVPLHQELELTPESSHITRFVSVPPSVVRQKYPGSLFHGTCAINAAFRNAVGAYLIMMPSDELLGFTALHGIMRLLTGQAKALFDPAKVGMWIPRKQVPMQFREDLLANHFSAIDKYLTLNEAFLKDGWYMPGLMSGAGALIVSRGMCHQLRGFDETLGGYGFNDVDFSLRISANFPVVSLSFLGVSVYDFEQTPDESVATKKNMNIFDQLKLSVNDAHWGLGDYDLEVNRLAASALTVAATVAPSQDHGTTTQKVPELSLATMQEARNLISVRTSTRIQRIPAHAFPLAWFALNNKCFKYFEYGTSGCADAAFVSVVNPCAELYCPLPVSIDHGHADDVHRLLELSDVLRSRHKGFVRFIPGKLDGLLETLAQSFIGSMYFDLVLFDSDGFCDDYIHHFEKVVRYIPSGGGVVVIGRHLQTIERWLDEHYDVFNGIVCKKHAVGLFLKGPLNGSMAQHQLERAWQPVKRRRFLLVLATVFHQIAQLSQELLFVDYRRWPRHIWTFTAKFMANPRAILYMEPPDR